MPDTVVASLIGFVIGVGGVALWAVWPMVKEVWYHGWRNDR